MTTDLTYRTIGEKFTTQIKSLESLCNEIQEVLILEDNMDLVLVLCNNRPFQVIKVELLGRGLDSLLNWYAENYDISREALTGTILPKKVIHAPHNFDSTVE